MPASLMIDAPEHMARHAEKGFAVLNHEWPGQPQAPEVLRAGAEHLREPLGPARMSIPAIVTREGRAKRACHGRRVWWKGSLDPCLRRHSHIEGGAVAEEPRINRGERHSHGRCSSSCPPPA